MSSVLEIGADGYAIPDCDRWLDQLNECGMDDEDFGDPADWPEWTDADRWELSRQDPPPEPEPPFEPSEQDWAEFHAWCREQDARNQDLEDAHRECEWQDLMERQSRYTDVDLQAAGLPVG